MVLHAGEIEHGDELRSIVENTLIALIPDDDNVFFDRKFADLLQCLLVIDSSGGVVGGIDDDRNGLVCHCVRNRFRRHDKIVILIRCHENRNAVQDLSHVLVIHPVRRGDDHLIAGIHEAAQCQEQSLHGAHRNLDLRIRVISDSCLALDPLCRRFSQLNNACVRRILGLSCHDRVASRFFDIVRGLVVRVAQGKIDDVIILLGHVKQFAGQRGLDPVRHFGYFHNASSLKTPYPPK